MTDMRYKKKKDVWGQNKKHQQGSTKIRGHARKEMNKNNLPLDFCWLCYKPKAITQIEIMHLIAASSFDDEALVGEINHPINLFAGCKTCHSYYDSPKVKDKKWLEHKRNVLIRALELSNKQTHIDFIDKSSDFSAPINFEKEIIRLSKAISERDKFWDTISDGNLSEIPFKNDKCSDKKLITYRKTSKIDALVPPVGCSQYHKIRMHARAEAYKHKLPNKCMIDGCKNNDTNVQISHMIDIPQWGDDTPLGIINHLQNLRSLCGEHNNMFDNEKNVDAGEYDEFLKKLRVGHQRVLLKNKIKPKIVGGVKYVYNIDNPHKFKVVEIDLGKDKGFWG